MRELNVLTSRLPSDYGSAAYLAVLAHNIEATLTFFGRGMFAVLTRAAVALVCNYCTNERVRLHDGCMPVEW